MWGYIIWGIILFIIIGMLVRLRSLFSIYVCPKCQTEFTLTPISEFLYPQVMYKKIVRCPSCKKIVSAAIIRNQDSIEQLEKAQQAKLKQKSRSNGTQVKKKVLKENKK